MTEKFNTTELASIEENELEIISGGATISYGALRANNIRRPGASQQANSYNRGCSAATRCRS